MAEDSTATYVICHALSRGLIEKEAITVNGRLDPYSKNRASSRARARSDSPHLECHRRVKRPARPTAQLRRKEE